MNTQKYYIVTINLPEQKEKEFGSIEESALAQFSCGGIEEFALDEANVDQILGLRAYSGFDIPDEVFDEVEVETMKRFGMHYKFFFYDEESKKNAEAFKKFIDEKHPYASPRLIEEGWQDWNAEWKKHYHTLQISERLKVVPEWEKGENWKQDPDAIYIIPGMGFGTGNHETTCLCLKFLDELPLSKPNSVLDFGCGSGILGIAAMKKHGSLVDFCDIDRKALDNCLENIKLNFDDDKLEGQRLVARDRYSLNENHYELVLANILEPVLNEEKDLILGSVKKNGHLIVSGLLLDQLDRVSALYTNGTGFALVKKETKGQWGALLFKKH